MFGSDLGYIVVFHEAKNAPVGGVSRTDAYIPFQS